MMNDEIKETLIYLNKLADDYRVYPDEVKALDKAIYYTNIIKRILDIGETDGRGNIYIGGRLFSVQELAQ